MRKEFQFWKICQNFGNKRAPSSEPCLYAWEYESRIIKYLKEKMTCRPHIYQIMGTDNA